MISNTKAVALARTYRVFETAFSELVLWQLPHPLAGSTHRYKSRLAFVVNSPCVIRYDNEAGKDAHRHYKGKEAAQRADRDVNAAHSDISASLNAGGLERDDDGLVVFPYEAVKMALLLQST
jgi:hypothetical protein